LFTPRSATGLFLIEDRATFFNIPIVLISNKDLIKIIILTVRDNTILINNLIVKEQGSFTNVNTPTEALEPKGPPVNMI